VARPCVPGRLGAPFFPSLYIEGKGLSNAQRPIRQRTDPPWRTLNAQWQNFCVFASLRENLILIGAISYSYSYSYSIRT
jgi:hypothetical protein